MLFVEKKSNLIRTRFAPSPTGELHLGGARTTLINYLFAKQHQGQFVLRIEDTDIKRSHIQYINNQYHDLLWLGLNPDESPFKEGKYGPYRQIMRVPIHQEYAQQLLKKKKSYYCFCSKEELTREKEEFLTKNKSANYQYSRKCLQLSQEKIQNFLQEQKPYVLRLKIPKEKDYIFQDLVRGRITFRGRDIEDFVIFRSNGISLLNFAVVIDDHLMEISHVLRGEEHLPNTSKQLVLYESLGWIPPQFGHLSIILNKERKKLSKRDQETKQFQMIYQLREKGYLPQAIINYLLFLGWHPGEGITQEIFSLEEAIKNFNLKGLHSRGAVFDLEKLNWYNNYYIQQLKENEFADYAWKVLEQEHKIPSKKREWAIQIAFLFRPQLNYFQELISLTHYFFHQLNHQLLSKDPENTLWIEELVKKLEKTKEWEIGKIKDLLKETFSISRERKKEIFLLLRSMLTGKEKGPELPKVIFLLGKDETIERLKI